MNDIKTSLEHAKRIGTKVVDYASRHRIIVMFALVGVAVSFALIKTRSFIDIPRNEARYSEEQLKIHYEVINEQTLSEFKSADQDQSIEVNSKFNPNRSNPFNE